jgi:hypothetical protein
MILEALEFLADCPRQREDGLWYAHWRLRHHFGDRAETGPEEKSSLHQAEAAARRWYEEEAAKFALPIVWR